MHPTRCRVTSSVIFLLVLLAVAVPTRAELTPGSPPQGDGSIVGGQLGHTGSGFFTDPFKTALVTSADRAEKNEDHARRNLTAASRRRQVMSTSSPLDDPFAYSEYDPYVYAWSAWLSRTLGSAASIGSQMAPSAQTFAHYLFGPAAEERGKGPTATDLIWAPFTPSAGTGSNSGSFAHFVFGPVAEERGKGPTATDLIWAPFTRSAGTASNSVGSSLKTGGVYVPFQHKPGASGIPKIKGKVQETPGARRAGTESVWTTASEASLASEAGRGVPSLESDYAPASSVVPEPSTWLLLATGLLGLGFLSWRRNRKPEAPQEQT